MVGFVSSSRKPALLLVLRHYGRALRRHRRVAIPALLLPALGNVGQLYVAPLIVAAVVGRLAHDQHADAADLMPFVLSFAGVLLMSEVLWRIGIHCLNRAEARGIEDLYVLAMDELLARDSAFFHDNFAGSLTKRALSFATRYELFVDTLGFTVFADIVPVGFAAVMLWLYNPVLVLVLLGLLAFTGLAIAPLVRRRQEHVDRREAAIARVAGHVADSVSNADTVRAFAAERREADEHRKRVAESRRLTLVSWDYANLRIDTIVAPLFVLTNAAGLFLAIRLGGELGVAAIVVTFTYYTNATRIMFEFNRIYRQLESALTEAAQFTELLARPPGVLDPASPEPPARTGTDVHLNRVSFGYEAGRPLFEDLEITVPTGTKVGLVGRSGGGKTTLIRLLLRFMDVDAGRILIGGQDITRLRQHDLRSLLAYVPQEPAMFHRTLRENIAFARPDADDEEVRRAVHAAHLTEFVATLPEGLDTIVGERGIKLSGGQRQRVALARAILQDAPVLLLDEATSALDSESERLVQEALWTLMQGRTAIVVAHRLSTVAQMDRLIVLDHGRIVEHGTHAELLARHGTYTTLWRHQSGGFLGETKELRSATALSHEHPRTRRP